MAESKRSTNTSSGREEKQPFYLFNDDQSMRIQTIGMAMRGIGDLIRSEGSVVDAVDHEVNRVNVAAIFDLIAQSLDDTLPEKGRRFAYLNPDEIKGTVQ